ncbi:MAG: AAA family ATPase [Lachnospiraceae bacterium]|nr:AAA family ATPase [Lachnospiraceae bacterium]
MSVIMFSGVHGVGKGYFLEKNKNSLQQYKIYSASKLIEKYQPSTDAGYKKVSDVNHNQEILIRAIREEAILNETNCIIDGHLCIYNAKGEVERVPEYFFVKAGITGIVLLQDDPQVICNRISLRDSEQIRVEDIGKMQDEEEKYAHELQEKFQIVCKVISHKCTGKQLKSLLLEMGGQT